MGPPNECVSCGGSAKTTAKQVTEISAISGRNLREIVTSHFWQDAALMESMGRKAASLCRDCHSLLEQIDAFEQSLMKTRETFENRRVKNNHINENNSLNKNSKIKKEGIEASRDIDSDDNGTADIPNLKQEPDDWTPPEDFEWDGENPNNFLDATLQEDVEDRVNNGSYIDEDDSMDEDYDDREDFDESFVPKGIKTPKSATRSKTSKSKKSLELSQHDMCLAQPDRKLVCLDKTSLGADWFAEQRLQLTVILTEFELDLMYLREKMPAKLTTPEESLDWNITMLRSEAETLDSALPGDLTCLHCHKDFDSVCKKIEHVIEFHSGDERQFICGICPEYDEIDECNMYTHISENHVVTEENSEKSRYGPRNPEPNDIDQTYACRLCPIVSRSELAYWYHWYCRHKKYRSRQCDICGKSTGISTASQFRSHFLTEHCNYVYECYDCEAHLTTADLFIVHIKEHENNKVVTSILPATLLTKTGRIKKRNYPSERKTRTKRNSVGIKLGDGAVPEDDSNAEPLTPLMRVQQNPDVRLEPTSEHAQLELGEQLSAEMWQDLCTGLGLLKTMPSKIDSDIVSLEWDITLLKLECPKLALGIPGEKKCFKCEEFFVAIPEKQSHCLNSHMADPFFCPICQQAFGKEASGVSHMLTKHGELWKQDERLKVPENYTPCEICGLSCLNGLAYWQHKFQSHKRYKNVNCPLCETSCNNFVVFLRHVLIKHGSYKYKCFLCDKASKTMESFKDHLKQHEKGKIKKEIIIGDDDEDSVFEREEIEINGKKILRKKIGKKGKKPPVACEICGTISKGAFNNARHLYTMHGIKREVQCDKCDTLCESVRAMLDHKKNHHSSASCHLCGKVFVEKGHLENHLMRHGIGKDGKNHENERDFMCEICSKTFTRKNYLVIHMKNHADKSIKCTVCSKMFRWNSALQAHLTAAHGMGPKEGACTCEFCGRQFQDKSNYRQHRYTHLQVKPFNCEACGKGFIRRDLMKSHKEKCHAATTFSMG